MNNTKSAITKEERKCPYDNTPLTIKAMLEERWDNTKKHYWHLLLAQCSTCKDIQVVNDL